MAAIALRVMPGALGTALADGYRLFVSAQSLLNRTAQLPIRTFSTINRSTICSGGANIEAYESFRGVKSPFAALQLTNRSHRSPHPRCAAV